MWFALAFFIGVLVLLNVSGYFGIKTLLAKGANPGFRKFAPRVYWLIDVIFILFSLVFAFFIRSADNPEHVQYRQFFIISGGFTLILVVKTGFLLFVALHYLKNLLSLVGVKIFENSSTPSLYMQRVRKTNFLLKAGVVFSSFLFLAVLHGIFFGRYNFHVEKVDVFIEGLPPAFEGLRVVHFSDTHLGSFKSIEPVAKGIKMMADLKPDLIVFSGDMVNNVADEAERFIPVFQKLDPPLGMFSVLGNHDMGDYRRWGTIPETDSNIERLIEIKQEMGFDVLLNEHRFIKIGNDSVMIAGVKNWGQPPFAKYGNLEKAIGTNAGFPVKLLISHDPSHWRGEILPLTNIQLTFSGHTHGFQFGIITPFFKWSPVQWKYSEWIGLYQEGNQLLYVNGGFGFLGFPGRVGVPPEITLLTLKKK